MHFLSIITSPLSQEHVNGLSLVAPALEQCLSQLLSLVSHISAKRRQLALCYYFITPPTDRLSLLLIHLLMVAKRRQYLTWLIYLPLHSLPSPWSTNPGAHLQVGLPFINVHLAFSSQPPFLMSHLSKIEVHVFI